MSSTDPPARSVAVRRASAADADAIADVHVAARRAAVPAMPPIRHTEAEVRHWIERRVGSDDDVWVAEVGGSVVGYSRIVGDWLDDLYVAPGHTGHGIGGTLLDVAKSGHPGGFSLWVFDSNTGARRFYSERGLVELEHTDGRGNQERSPDVRMVWPGEDPLAFLRRLIDEVDDDLATTLARRVALTRVIQQFKPVSGQAGRDPEREQEIAQRMADRAPALPAEAWRRIMHEVITAGLDITRSGGEVEGDASP